MNQGYTINFQPASDTNRNSLGGSAGDPSPMFGGGGGGTTKNGMKMHNMHSSSLAKGASQSSSALLVSGLTGLSLVQSAQGGARGKHLNLIKEEDAPNENTIPFDSSMSGGNNEDVSPKLGGNGGAGNRRNHTGGLPISNTQHARQPPVSSSL